MSVDKKVFVFDVHVPSEHSAGLRGCDDTIRVVVESGFVPETEPNEFGSFLADALSEWYDHKGSVVYKGEEREIAERRRALQIQQRIKRAKEPSLATLERWVSRGVAKATDGCRVDPDGHCKHGCPSWLLHLGLI